MSGNNTDLKNLKQHVEKSLARLCDHYSVQTQHTILRIEEAKRLLKFAHESAPVDPSVLDYQRHVLEIYRKLEEVVLKESMRIISNVTRPGSEKGEGIDDVSSTSNPPKKEITKNKAPRYNKQLRPRPRKYVPLFTSSKKARKKDTEEKPTEEGQPKKR